MENTKKETKQIVFGWFDWIILIAAGLLSLMYLFNLTILIMYGNLTFYTQGMPERSFIMIFIWLAIFAAAFVSKLKKFNKSKASK